MNLFYLLAGSSYFSEKSAALLSFFVYAVFFIPVVIFDIITRIFAKKYAAENKHLNQARIFAYVLASAAIALNSVIYIFGSNESADLPSDYQTALSTTLDEPIVWLGSCGLVLLIFVVVVQIGMLFKRCFSKFQS